MNFRDVLKSRFMLCRSIYLKNYANGRILFDFQKCGSLALAAVAKWVGVLSGKPKDHRVGTWSGHMPGLWVQSPVGGVYERQLIDVSLPLSPSLPLSLKLIIMSLREDKKNK